MPHYSDTLHSMWRSEDLTGYVRSDDGRWRYADTGEYVPGGRDMTLARLYRFRADPRHVHVPTHLTYLDPDLAWTRTNASHRLHGRTRIGAVEYLAVDREEWDRRAREPLGLEAPELQVSRMLSIADISNRLAIRPATTRAYVTRGYLPPATVTKGGSPLWSVPILSRHLSRSQRLTTTTKPRSTRPPQAPSDAPAHTDAPDDELMAHLDALIARRATRRTSEETT